MDEIRSENAYERTAKLAYELWELRGCPEGSPEVDWAAAEEVLASSREVVEKTPSSVATPERVPARNGLF